jgi:hypothetical protein
MLVACEECHGLPQDSLTARQGEGVAVLLEKCRQLTLLREVRAAPLMHRTCTDLRAHLHRMPSLQQA